MDPFVAGFIKTQISRLQQIKTASSMDMLLGGAGGYMLGQKQPEGKSITDALPTDMLTLLLIYLLMKRSMPDLFGNQSHRVV